MAGLFVRGEISEKQYGDYRVLTFVEPNFNNILFRYSYPKRQEGEDFMSYWGKRLFGII